MLSLVPHHSIPDLSGGVTTALLTSNIPIVIMFVCRSVPVQSRQNGGVYFCSNFTHPPKATH